MLLMIQGRTAHSGMGIPIPIEEGSVSYLSVQSDQAKTIKSAGLIVWDEVLMSHRHNLECSDRLLRELKDNDVPFGGTPTVFSGDFRQILPVIPSGNEASIVGASLLKSYLWKDVQVLHLTTNMRIEKVLKREGPEAADRCSRFNQRLLDTGIGRVNGVKSEDVLCDPAWRLKDDTVDQLIKEIYGDLDDLQVTSDHAFLLGRCILAATNEQCSVVNDRCMELFHVSLRVSYDQASLKT